MSPQPPIPPQTRHAEMLRSALSVPILDLLRDAEVTEIMANADGRVWVERQGQPPSDTGMAFPAGDRDRVIRLVAAGLAETGDRPRAIISAELPDTGERFEGLLPPIVGAPCFSIRKPAAQRLTLDDLLRSGTITAVLVDRLRMALADRQTIVIAGGTSSGKTTLANALLDEPAITGDRLIVLEDIRELTSPAQNHVCLRTQANSISLNDLVRSALRLRPDRIIVGEVRGGEALDLLKAWNTGHPGGITTLHASSTHGALTRLEQLTLEACRQPPRALIAEAIDIVLFMDRRNGVRRVTDAIRLTGLDGEAYLTEPLITPALSLVTEGIHS